MIRHLGSAARAGLAAAALTAAAAAPANAGVALSTSGWEWSDPQPQGYALNATAFQGASGLAVGDGGTVLKTADGGATWSGLFTGTGLRISRVDMIDGNNLAIDTQANNRCSIRVSKNGGATFTRILIGSSEVSCAGDSISDFDFVSGDLGYIMRDGGAVLKTTDAGASLANASTVDAGTSLAFVTDSRGFATGRGGIYRTVDGAATWTLVKDAATYRNIRSLDSTHLIAWGGGNFLRSDDAGETWKDMPGMTGAPAQINATTTGLIAYVLDGKLVLSDDNGATGRTVTVGNSDIVAASWVTDSRIIAVGKAGVTYVSDDKGATFTKTSSNPVAPALSGFVQTAGGPVGLGKGSIAVRAGGAWQVRSTLSGQSVYDADFSSAQNGYILHADGSVYRTKTGGATWSNVDTGTPSDPTRVLTPDDNTTLLVGGFGVYRATEGGSFSRVEGPSGFGRASHVGTRVIWANNTGNRKKARVFVSRDGGKRWKSISIPKSLPLPINGVTMLPSGGFVLDVYGDRLFRSGSDSGKSLTEMLVGDQNGFSAAGASEYFAISDGPWGSVVLHTTNAGKTWQPQAVGSSTNAGQGTLVTSGAKTAFLLAYSDGAIFQTTTGGSRGNASSISIKRTKTKLKRVGGKIQISGQLTGATGGEQVLVQIRVAGKRAWTQQLVTVGANGGGSFTANFIGKKGTYSVLAGWTGDSGRAGSMTAPLTVKVIR
ncbi:MAG: hypothetical protein V9E83_13215 [Baekduia sp.]